MKTVSIVYLLSGGRRTVRASSEPLRRQTACPCRSDHRPPGGDDAGEVGARGDVFVLAAQRVGDGFSRGLGLGDLFVELGELAVGELPPAVDRVGARCEESLRFAKRARQDGLVNVGFEHGAVQAALKPHLTSDGVRLGSRAWLVTARSPG